LSVSSEAKSEGEIQVIDFPRLQYATTRISGGFETCAEVCGFLYTSWLPRSVYEPEHFPGIEIFLDKEKVLDWSHFELELAIPIKKI
jgi:DNA gyrase inhibitor GyrI